MVNEIAAVWESEPLVASAEMENWPVLAAGDAPIITETGWPMRTEKGLAGLLVIPAGTPASVTCTSPEKPFSAVTLTVMGALELPCAILTVEVEKPIAKSGCGGGG